MKTTKNLFFCLLIGSSSSLATAKDSSSSISLSLPMAEKMLLENSPDSRALDAYLNAYDHKIEAVETGHYPKLSLEGAYTHVENVPSLTQGANTIQLGDQKNYSFGPAISFKIYDGGVLSNTIKSLKQMRSSRAFDKEALTAMNLFAARLAYLNVLIHEEHYKLSQESLKLSERQNLDIKRKRKLGASSQLDLSLSNRDLLNQKLQNTNAKLALEKAIIELSSLLSKDSTHKVLFTPVGSLDTFGTQTQFDSLDEILKVVSLSSQNFSNKPAQLEALDSKIQSAVYEANSVSSQYIPKVFLKLKSSMDYPNGPSQEQIHQKTLSINLSMPLYDWGEISSSKAEKQAQVTGLQAQREKLERDIHQKLEKLKLELQHLKEQEPLVESLVVETSQVAKIHLNSFRSGRIQFTEVERANVRMFEAQVQKLLLKGQIFSTLSQIIAISTGGIK